VVVVVVVVACFALVVFAWRREVGGKSGRGRIGGGFKED